MPTDPVTPLLAQPTRARVLSNLAGRRRPARVEAIAEDLDVHPNTVRLHLEKLAEAGFAVSRTGERDGPGRPPVEWSAIGGGLPIQSAYRALSRWLLRGMEELDVSADEIRATGRSIGHDMAAGRDPERAVDALRALLTALGFRPEAASPDRFRLCHCPFRVAAEENPVLVCSLHHGIVEGFTEAVDPGSRIDLFEPRPPSEAGCLVGVAPTA